MLRRFCEWKKKFKNICDCDASCKSFSLSIFPNDEKYTFSYTLLPDPVTEFVAGLVEDVVNEESVKAVRGAVHELIDEHLAKAAAYDSMWNMVDDLVREEAPNIVSVLS